MLRFLSRLLRGYWNTTEINPELFTDWGFVENINETQQANLSSELDELRRKNSSSARAILLKKVVEELKDESIEWVMEISLPVDLRTRIFKDLITKISPSWLMTLEKIAPGIESRWYSSSYEKNFIGQIIDMTDRTAPDKLNSSGVAQVLRGIHIGLVQAVSSHRGIPTTLEETEQLLNMIAETIIHPLLKLWIETAKRVKESLFKQGRLPERWAQEKKKEEERLARIKAEGVFARYSVGDRESARVGKEEIERRRQLLSNNLFLKKTTIEEVRPANFLEAKAFLEKNLKR